MATIGNDPGGRRRILFVGPSGKRHTIRLGKVSDRIAQTVRLKVESLLAAKVANQSIDRETAAWLADIDDRLHDRLARAELAPRRVSAMTGPATLDAFLEGYIKSRAKLKPNTTRNLMQTRRILTEHFGAQRQLRSISEGHADGYREKLLQDGYSPATVSREIKRARQYFKAAVRSKLIDTNPFAEVKAESQANSDRDFFVTRQTAQAVLDACPDNEWRLIFALSRFGGLRCPSEHLSLTWNDIDWERDRIHVRSPKTEHLKGGASRTIPLFPELRAHLEEQFERAEPGTVHVICRARGPNANLRTQFLRILEAAKIPAWPKLFHNLRASRETELADEFPIHVVCEWIGNSPDVARKHYFTVTDDHFARAAGEKAAQNPAQSVHAESRTDSHDESETAAPLAFAGGAAVLFQTQVPPRGVEPRFSD